MTPVYYTITNYESGTHNTGKRNANYHCFLQVFDGDKRLIEKNKLNDSFYGKWIKCEKVIRKWRALVNKYKLKSLPNEQATIISPQ